MVVARAFGRIGAGSRRVRLLQLLTAWWRRHTRHVPQDDRHSKVGAQPEVTETQHSQHPSDPTSDSEERAWVDHRACGASLTAEQTRQALNDPDPYGRALLAHDTDDPDAIAALARDPHPHVRAATLSNELLSAADVEMLANDRIARVRATVASLRRAAPTTLTRLAGDRSSAVRWEVLFHNPERLDLAAKLVDDPHEDIAHQARSQLQDPKTFTAFLGKIDLVF